MGVLTKNHMLYSIDINTKNKKLWRFPYSKAYRRGYADCVAGRSKCPFACGTKEWEYWDYGWGDAIPERQRKVKHEQN